MVKSPCINPAIKLLPNLIQVKEQSENGMQAAKQKLNLSLIIIVIALCARLPITLINYYRATEVASIYQSSLVNNTDALDYLRLAENMLEHGEYSTAQEAPFQPDLKRVPGYPVFLAFLYILAGGQHSALLILSSNLLLSLLNIWLLMQIARELFSREVALIAGFIYALAPISIALTNQAMSESLFTALILTTVYLVLRLKLESWREVFIAAVSLGLLLGITTYVRAIAFYILPIFLLYWIARFYNPKKNLLLVAVSFSIFLAVVMPWYLRNYNLFGVLTFSSVSDGNLITYNAASVYAEQEHLSLRQAKDALHARVEAYFEAHPELDQSNPAIVASIRRQVAVDVLLGNPVLSIWVHIQDSLNAFRPGYSEMNLVFFDLDEAFGNNVGTDRFPNIAELNPMQIIVFGYASLYYAALYLATGLGLILLLWQRQWLKLLLLSVLPYWFALSPSIAGNSRFRVPIEGFMALLAAYVLVFSWQAVKTRKTQPSLLAPAQNA
jgi:4-amino-4-deoxy-L-arabinose transferase-like glycosyltransferase